MKVNWNEEKSNLESLINEGVSYEKIGTIYGVCGNAIKKAAIRLGITLPSRRKINSKEHFNKGDKLVQHKKGYNQCPQCGELKYFTSELCSKCRNLERKGSLKERTLGSYISGFKYLTTKCGDIRKDARKTLEASSREKVCQYCNNHDYDDILEVHHLKGILEFDKSAKIKEINDEANLVWLCPNHHKMLELNLIQL